MQIMEREVTAAMQQVGATNVNELVPEMVIVWVISLAILLNFSLRSNRSIGNRS